MFGADNLSVNKASLAPIGRAVRTVAIVIIVPRNMPE